MHQDIADEDRFEMPAAWLRALPFVADRGDRLRYHDLVRDAMLPALWTGAWMQSAIVWRGNAMDIRPKEADRLRPRIGTA